MKEPLATCERTFLSKAITGGIRLDGRNLNEFRKVKINFGSDWGCVQVSLGETRVLAQVSCEIQQPKPTRPNEGLLNINLELSPMGSPYFELGRQTEIAVQLNRLLEKSIKDSKCVDLESLCIVAEEKVWSVRVDVNVLNHEGNLMDCASIATLVALAHFKRPDVTNTGEQIIIHSSQDKDPLPIVLHHYPVCISFAIFNQGNNTVADPSALEERVCEAQIVLGVNAFKELCGLYLGGSVLASPTLVLTCAAKAATRASIVVQLIKDSIIADAEIRTSKASFGFKESIRQNKITSLSHKRIFVRLKKSDPNQPDIKFNLTSEGNHLRFDDDGYKIPFADEGEESKVLSLGNGSAELLFNQKSSIGQGGKNTWTADNSDNSDESDNEIEVKEIPDVKIDLTSFNDDGSSEEEATVLLDEKIEMNVKAKKAKIDKGRRG